MSLHAAAQHLASKGRGPDTLLVHMAPGEVAGLQALAKAHGGSLTVNPQTGLPEAGFLSGILPMVLGAASTAMTGNPYLGMALAGGLKYQQSGSLGQGLLAGLGAYGGGEMMSGLMGAGAGALGGEAAAQTALETAPQVAAQAAPQVAAEAAPQAMQTAATAANPTGIPGFSGSTVGLTPPPSATPAFADQAVSSAAPQTVTPMSVADQQAAVQKAMEDRMANATDYEKFKAGFGNLGAMANKDMAKAGLYALTPMLFEPPKNTPYKGSGPNPYDFNFSWERGAPGYDSREYSQLRGIMTPIRHAEGGPISDMSEQNAQLTLMANGGQMLAEGGQAKDAAQGMTGTSADAMRYLMGQSARSPATAAAQNYSVQPATPQMAVVKHQPLPSNGGLISRMVSAMGNTEPDPNVPYSFNFNPATGIMSQGAPVMRQIIPTATTMDSGNYAGGGIAALGGYSDGGRMLRGPGDGVSDSIPAVIGDRSPARLADGEFVVPARIVSELGNGSSEAGARKLYAMMDRVQKARSKTTGKNKVAVNSRADKALPA